MDWLTGLAQKLTSERAIMTALGLGLVGYDAHDASTTTAHLVVGGCLVVAFVVAKTVRPTVPAP
jgi:hypothetical protein